MKKYVLTGGPGAGKTSILTLLRAKGETTIAEAASDHIETRQKRGMMEPWLERDFQERILEIQIAREKEISPSIKRVFVDRGIGDGLAYTNPQDVLYFKIEKEAREARYEKIFIIDSLDTVEMNNIRRENRKESIIIRDRLIRIYQCLEYEPIIVPAAPLTERVEYIMARL